MRSTRFVAGDTGVEKTYSSEFRMEMKRMNNYNRVCEKRYGEVMPGVLWHCSERVRTEIRGRMFAKQIGVTYS